MPTTSAYPPLSSLNLRSLGQSIARLDHLYQAILRNRFGRTVRALAPFIHAGQAVYDIGANHGKFARNFARLHRASCPVLCFEPLPYNLDILRITTRGFPNIRILPLALSDRAGSADFFIPAKKSGRISHGAAHLASDGATVSHATLTAPLVYKHTVTTDTLDAAIAREKLPAPALLKIDVQGAECLVFDGGRETLRAHTPAIHVELVEICPGYVGRTPQHAFDALEPLGYRAFAADENRAALPGPPVGAFTPGIRDYLFLHPSRHSAFIRA